ncbi:hypothetical protein WEH80_16175 [Actinomycetes bacterium KLBMP 9759]
MRAVQGEDGSDTATVTAVTGEVVLDAIWTRSDIERARRHLDRHDPGRESVLAGSAGTLVLVGPGRLRLGGPAQPGRRECLEQLRPRLNDHEVLRDSAGRGDPRWTHRLAYVPEAPPDGWRPPVWLTLSFTPNAGRRALDLLVQWDTGVVRHPDAEPLTATVLKALTVQVPADWGEVTQFTMNDVETFAMGRSGTTRTFKWQKVAIEDSARGRCLLAMAFPSEVDADGRVTGKIEMEFRQTASGVRNIHLHAAGGARRWWPKPAVKTIVVVDFDLLLSRAGYQSMRTVPDRKLDPDEVHMPRTYDGVAPDYQLIGELVSTLSGQRHLVKSIVEHPPSPGPTAGTQNRTWDITGRRYSRVHPTDFRLAVSGTDVETHTGRSRTTVALTVQGAYAAPETEELIRSIHEELWSRIESVLDHSRIGADGGVRLSEQPFAAAELRDLDIENALISVQSVVHDAVRERQLPTVFVRRLLGLIDDALGRRGSR